MDGVILIDGRTSDIGFPVRRLLPSLLRRSVGPFVFLDHMGPARFAKTGTDGDVRPHPHIGLSTITWLFRGALMHRDSLGSVQRIEPGELNWMRAGRGIVHSERVPEELRAAGQKVEGIQSWLALPHPLEDAEPAFRHYPAARLPNWQEQGVRGTLLAGRWHGLRAPLDAGSPTLYAELRYQTGAQWWNPPAYPEQALYVAHGELEIDGVVVRSGRLAVLPPEQTVLVRVRREGVAMLLGGEPLDGPRTLWWNFVASDPAHIEQAKADWQAGRFAPVPGETEFIPLPLG